MKARCKLCGVQLVLGDGTASSALHLSAKHPEEYNYTSEAQSLLLTTIVCKCSLECAATITKLRVARAVCGKRPLSMENCDWRWFPATPEYYQARVPSTVTHLHH